MQQRHDLLLRLAGRHLDSGSLDRPYWRTL
jgi:hypothetical protein